MTRLRRSLAVGLVTAAVAAGAVVPASAAAPVQKDEFAASAASASFDANTVFRGLFFGHGPVAALIPQYFEGVVPESADTLAFENKFIAELEQRAPGTVDRLHQAVTSGSHVRTKQALTETTALVEPLLAAKGDQVRTDGQAGRAVVVALPAAVAVVVWVWKWTWTYSSSGVNGQGPISTDNLVHDLVTNLV